VAEALDIFFFFEISSILKTGLSKEAVGCGQTVFFSTSGPYLVGGLEHFLFFHILGIMIPTD